APARRHFATAVMKNPTGRVVPPARHFSSTRRPRPDSRRKSARSAIAILSGSCVPVGADAPAPARGDTGKLWKFFGHRALPFVIAGQWLPCATPSGGGRRRGFPVDMCGELDTLEPHDSYRWPSSGSRLEGQAAEAWMAIVRGLAHGLGIPID